MISYGILAGREQELKARTKAGAVLTEDEIGLYRKLCLLTVGAALELYRYEYGHLPASVDELVKLDYFDALPADPAADWAPLSVNFWRSSAEKAPTAASKPVDAVDTGLDVIPAASGDGSYDMYDELIGMSFAAPAPTWFETEARLHGMDYKAYEDHMTQLYPDRVLWPASKVVVPPAAAKSH